MKVHIVFLCWYQFISSSVSFCLNMHIIHRTTMNEDYD
jgi:hypothetical protein